MGSGSPSHVTAQGGSNFYNATTHTQTNIDGEVPADTEEAKMAAYVLLGILTAFALVLLISPGSFISVDLH